MYKSSLRNDHSTLQCIEIGFFIKRQYWDAIWIISRRSSRERRERESSQVQFHVIYNWMSDYKINMFVFASDIGNGVQPRRSASFSVEWLHTSKCLCVTVLTTTSIRYIYILNTCLGLTTTRWNYRSLNYTSNVSRRLIPRRKSTTKKNNEDLFKANYKMRYEL